MVRMRRSETYNARSIRLRAIQVPNLRKTDIRRGPTDFLSVSLRHVWKEMRTAEERMAAVAVIVVSLIRKPIITKADTNIWNVIELTI